MANRFRCPCGTVLSSDLPAGSKVRCGKCQTVLLVPTFTGQLPTSEPEPEKPSAVPKPEPEKPPEPEPEKSPEPVNEASTSQEESSVLDEDLDSIGFLDDEPTPSIELEQIGQINKDVLPMMELEREEVAEKDLLPESLSAPVVEPISEPRTTPPPLPSSLHPLMEPEIAGDLSAPPPLMEPEIVGDATDLPFMSQDFELEPPKPAAPPPVPKPAAATPAESPQKQEQQQESFSMQEEEEVVMMQEAEEIHSFADEPAVERTPRKKKKNRDRDGVTQQVLEDRRCFRITSQGLTILFYGAYTQVIAFGLLTLGTFGAMIQVASDFFASINVTPGAPSEPASVSWLYVILGLFLGASVLHLFIQAVATFFCSWVPPSVNAKSLVLGALALSVITPIIALLGWLFLISGDGSAIRAASVLSLSGMTFVVMLLFTASMLLMLYMRKMAVYLEEDGTKSEITDLLGFYLVLALVTLAFPVLALICSIFPELGAILLSLLLSLWGGIWSRQYVRLGNVIGALQGIIRITYD